MTDPDLPKLYQQADALALSNQRNYLLLIRLDLGLGLLGAIIAFVSGILPTSAAAYVRGLSLAAAVVLISAVVFRSRLGFSSQVARRWFDARALAESMKTAAWEYSMRAGPFKHDATADDEFHKYLTRLKRKLGKEVAGHLPEVATRDQITEAMRTLRTLDPEPRRDHYLSERLEEQEEYYSRRAKVHEARSRLWFGVSLCFELLAVVFAAVKALGVPTGNPIPLFVAIAGAATAINQLLKHDELAHSYRSTRDQLEDLGHTLKRAGTEDSLDKAVVDIENVMSQEHKGWIVRR